MLWWSPHVVPLSDDLPLHPLYTNTFVAITISIMCTLTPPNVNDVMDVMADDSQGKQNCFK